MPDAIITLLLLTSIGFCGISVIGLLLFPDIRSRSHTAVRAGMIGCGAFAAAGILYSLFLFLTQGGNQYLFLFALILVIIVANGTVNIGINRIILKRANHQDRCQTPNDDILKK